jgi:hypothetical protein
MAPPSDLFDEPSYILSIPHMPKVESCILGLALRFILLGRMDTARDFTELLHSRPRLQNLEFAGLRALVPYWHKTYFPPGFPRNMKTDGYFSNYIHSEQQKGLEWPFYVPQDQRTEDEAGITAIMEPSLDRYDNPINSIRTVALDLAIKLAEKRGVEPSHDTKVLEIIDSIAEHFPKGWAQVHLVLQVASRCSCLELWPSPGVFLTRNLILEPPNSSKHVDNAIGVILRPEIRKPYLNSLSLVIMIQ